MTRVLLTACTGMLGNMLYRELHERYRLVLLYRDERKLAALDAAHGGLAAHTAVRLDHAELWRAYLAGGQPAVDARLAALGEVDAVVNSAGVIIPNVRLAPELTFFVNGALPHLLAAHYGERLIHVTTDCVYSGQDGAPYDETAPASPRDLYGLSKSMGEPADRALVLRTSIIGPELIGHQSLLEWLRSHRGGAVDGYVNHFWNGVTTHQLARSVDRIVEHRADYPAHGRYHVFGSDISKYELLVALNERFGLGIAVRPREVRPVDRRLATVHPLNRRLGTPTLPAMLAALPDPRPAPAAAR